MVEQCNQDIQRADARAGYLIALVHNITQKRPKEPSHWFPSLKPKPKRLKPGEEELREKIAAAKLQRELLGGGR